MGIIKLQSMGDHAMKTVLILRHAKSSWDDPALADHERPLNHRGQKDAPNVGKWLREHKLLPDLVLCSAALRARQTVEAVVEAAKFASPVHFEERFYDANPETWIDALVNLPEEADRVLLVGHNPTLQELVMELSGKMVALPTAALVEISLPLKKWADLRTKVTGSLVQVKLPREK